MKSENNKTDIQKENEILLNTIRSIFNITDSFEWHYKPRNTPEYHIWEKAWSILKER